MQDILKKKIRVEKAFENVKAFLRGEESSQNSSSTKEQKEGKDKRRHERYETREVFVDFELIKDGKRSGSTFRAKPVENLSASGMRFVVPDNAVIYKNDKMYFVIFRRPKTALMRGKGTIVRMDMQNPRRAGLRFDQVEKL